MAKKPSSEPSIHDQRVRQEVKKLGRQGWNIKVDLPGYDKPKSIGKNRRIPDIEATKRGHRKLVEVETPETVEKDKKQQATFRRHAGQKPNTSFSIIVTNK